MAAFFSKTEGNFQALNERTSGQNDRRFEEAENRRLLWRVLRFLAGTERLRQERRRPRLQSEVHRLKLKMAFCRDLSITMARPI